MGMECAGDSVQGQEAVKDENSGTGYFTPPGRARSAVWTQMKADVLNVPFTTLATANAGTVGSAMLTGIAVGFFQNLDEAAAHMVEKTRDYLPDVERHEKYMEVYRSCRKVYDAVRGLM